MSVSTTSNALERMKDSAVAPSGASVTSYASSRISAISNVGPVFHDEHVRAIHPQFSAHRDFLPETTASAPDVVPAEARTVALEPAVAVAPPLAAMPSAEGPSAAAPGRRRRR
jgi:hypothetical protein